MNGTQLSNRQKNSLFLVFLIVLLLIGWNIHTLITNQDTTVVRLELMPSDATVEVEGVKISGNSVRLKPGEYTIIASREGFYTKQQTLVIPEEGIDRIPVALGAKSDEAKAMVADTDSPVYEHAMSDAEIINPIIASLPVKTLLYSIEVDRNNLEADKPVTLIVSAPQGYRASAVQKVTQLGFTVSDYKYVFTNYEDPFQ